MDLQLLRVVRIEIPKFLGIHRNIKEYRVILLIFYLRVRELKLVIKADDLVAKTSRNEDWRGVIDLKLELCTIRLLRVTDCHSEGLDA